MARSLKDYYDIYLWINVLVYMLYIFIKCTVVIYLIISKKKESRRENNVIPTVPKLHQWFQPMKWIQWSVKLVFRNQLDLEDKLTPQELHVRENGQSNNEDGPKIELNHQSTVILFTLIATFGLLAIGSALNVTLLSVTHTCTEAPNINCYPQPINEVEV